MTYQERRIVEEFIKNAEKNAETQPVEIVRKAIEHMRVLCEYIDQLERVASR